MSNGVTIYGEKRRAVTFNLDSPEERALYELSKSLPFSRVVKRYLQAELQRRNGSQPKSTISARLEG